jgi:hypothetical protein
MFSVITVARERRSPYHGHSTVCSIAWQLREQQVVLLVHRSSEGPELIHMPVYVPHLLKWHDLSLAAATSRVLKIRKQLIPASWTAFCGLRHTNNFRKQNTRF